MSNSIETNINSIYEWAFGLYDEGLLDKVLPYIIEPTSEINFQISTQKEYEDLYRLQHDTILMTVQRDLGFVLDQKIQDFLLSKNLEIKLSPINKELTPDILLYKDNSIIIGELTVSNSPNQSYKSKKAKYSYLIYELKKVIPVDYKVTVFKMSGEPHIDEVKFPGHCTEIIRRFQTIIKHCMLSNPTFETNRLRSNDFITNFSQVQLPPEITFPKEINQEDSNFLNFIVNFIIKNPKVKTPETISIQELNDYYINARLEYVNKVYPNVPEDHKSLLKFPYYSTDIRRNRDTKLDDVELETILPIIEDLTGITLKRTEEKHSFSHKLSKQQRRIIAMEGPGAKRFLNLEEIKTRNLLQSNFICDIKMVYDELSSFLESSQAYRNEYKDIEGFLDENLMCRYLETVELLSREISLNAMRPGRKKNFILTPTDLDGVYILMFPGPPLRASETNSTVWFKFLSNKPILFSKLTQRHWHKNGWSQTRWLSLTAKKLDHYIRSKDQVVMAYFSHQSLSGPIEETVPRDTSDTLSLMTLIWVEDFRQTSTVLHDFRYFIMQKISLRPDFSRLKRKLLIPIRSPILYICIKRLLSFLHSTVDIEDFQGQLSDDKIDTLGASVQCDRVLTKGDKINFSQLINEMYFSMLFNKNEQEPSNDALQILDKILESEQDFEKSKSLGLVDIQGLQENLLSKLMLEDHPGGYSAEAIKIGVKLQLKDKENRAGPSAPHIACEKVNINKNLEQFATLKSSSIAYSEDERSKCLLEIIKLLDEGYETSFDVALEHINKLIEVQLFKKNQVGGTREISILDIISRIKVNIVETYFRNLCFFDNREMLTKGSNKFDIMRDNNKKTIGKTKFYFNGDATRWAQSFHTHQFKYLVGCHEVPLVGYIQHIFQQFTEKALYPPKALSNLWLKHQDDRGTNQLLNKQKQLFLQGEHKIKNESNMCQGILHYTSSYLHCCLISFIEFIISQVAHSFRLNVNFTSQVSSDDYLITIMTDIKQSRKNTRELTGEEYLRAIERIKKLQLLFFYSQTAIIFCQRLFNVHDSAKTSVTSSVYEFNSCFALRFTFLSPLIKFAVASVEPINTDSPSRMISEGINRVNQLIDNGGSINLTKYAHKFNRKYVQEITGLLEENLPYEVGVYPSEKLTTELYMFGAKAHNIKLLDKYDDLTPREQKIFTGVMVSQFSDPVEMGANLLFDDMKQHGKIILSTAPSRKWKTLIKRLPFNKQELNLKLIEDPLLLLKTHPSRNDQLIKCCLKAYTSNVRDSLRNTSPSIYYARYSTYKSAEAFSVDNDTKITYLNAVNSLESSVLLTREQLLMRYNDWRDVLTVVNLDRISFETALEKRPKFQSKRLNRIRLFTATNHIKTNIIKLLNYKWLSFEPDIRSVNQFERDWQLLKTRVSFLSDSFEETMSLLQSEYHLSQKDSIAYLYRNINLNLKEISLERKAFTYGFSTINIIDSFRMIYYENQFSDRRLQLYKEIINTTPIIEMLPILSIYDLFLRHSTIENFRKFIKLAKIADRSIEQELTEKFEDIYYSFDESFSRRKFIIMLTHLNLISEENFIKLLNDQKVIIRQWQIPQMKSSDGSWHGDCSVTYHIRDSALQLSYFEEKKTITLKMKQGLKWNEDIGLCLKQSLIDFKIPSEDLCKFVEPGKFSYNHNPTSVFESKGFHIQIDPDISYSISSFQVEINPERTIVSLCDHRGVLMRGLITIDPIHINYSIPDTPEQIFVNGFNIMKLMRYQFLIESFNVKSIKVPIEDFNVLTVTGIVKPTPIVSELLSKLGYQQEELAPEPVFEVVEEQTQTETAVDDFISYLIDLDPSDLKEFAFGIMNQPLNSDDLYDVQIDDSLIKFAMLLINPDQPVTEKKLHLRDLHRIDELPFQYYTEVISDRNFTAFEIASILRFKNFTQNWQLQVLIYLANIKIVTKQHWVLDPNIRFEEVQPIDGEDFSW
jgi:hypothetical protein